MTKAERRALQEQQRAAKLAARATAGGEAGGSSSGRGNAGSPSTPRRSNRSAEGAPRGSPAAPSRGARDRDSRAGTASVVSEATAAGVERRGGVGLRIFSHFGLQKPVSVAKGDIHPEILRLALQFSQFKITGANARCIATLRAFQVVGDLFCCYVGMNLTVITDGSAGNSGLCHSTE